MTTPFAAQEEEAVGAFAAAVGVTAETRAPLTVGAATKMSDMKSEDIARDSLGRVGGKE
jgi:hypothetical protein